MKRLREQQPPASTKILKKSESVQTQILSGSSSHHRHLRHHQDHHGDYEEEEEKEKEDSLSMNLRYSSNRLHQLMIRLQHDCDAPVQLQALSSLHALLEDEDEDDLLLAEDSSSCVASDCGDSWMETLPSLLRQKLWNEKNALVLQKVVRTLASLAILSLRKPGYALAFRMKKQTPELNTISGKDQPPPQRYVKSEINLNQTPDEQPNLRSEPTSAVRSDSSDFNLLQETFSTDHCSLRGASINDCSSLKEGAGSDPRSLKEEFCNQVVENLLLYLRGDCLNSLSLKLQTLRSLHHITEEGGIIPVDTILKLNKHLGSTNPFIKAHTLQLIAMVLVTNSKGKSLPGRETFIGLFHEYTFDPSVLVRKSALRSQILLHNNGYLLTKECYLAASSLLQDPDEDIRSISLHVIKLWVERSPEDNTNDAFIQVCKLMIDMDFSVRIEACKALAAMKNVKEDLLLQALSKQPLGLPSDDKEPIPSSLITIPETDVDVSKYDQGLSVLDKVNMGAFVHGIEDEFYEVRALTVKALETMFGCSTKSHNMILEMMMNMINDDSKHVRLYALQALIHASECYGLSVKDNDLHTLHATLDDIDEDVRMSGKRLLGQIQLSSKDGFKITVEALMNHIYKNPQEYNVIDALNRLGRGHKEYLQLMTKDLLNELKVHLSGDVGLDAPSCRCILTLLSSITEDANFIPSRVLSQAQLFKQVAHREHPVWPVDTICQDESIYSEPKSLLHTDSLNYKKRVETLLQSTIRSVWNIKNMLRHEMVSSMKQMLSGSRRDLKSLLGNTSDEDQEASTTLTLYYVECISLLLEGWICFHPKSSTAARRCVHQLSCRLDFIVSYMLHAFFGHTPEQKFALLEVSMLPIVWRMTEKVDMKDCKNVASIMTTLEKIGLPYSHFMKEVEENIVKASSSVDPCKVLRAARQLAFSFWPMMLPIGSPLRELKADLSIVSSDPLTFQIGLPVGIPVKVLFWNLKKSDRIWIYMHLSSLWSQYIFLNTESLQSVDEMVMTLIVPGLRNVSSECTVKATVILECPQVIHVNNPTVPEGYVLPLTHGKEIRLVDISSPRYRSV